MALASVIAHVTGPTAYGLEPWARAQAFALGSNQAQSLGLWIVVWFDSGLWPLPF